MASQIDPTLDGKLDEIGAAVPKPELKQALTAARDEITALQADAGGGGGGDPIPVFTADTAGLAPASGGGTANFLRADGNFAGLPLQPITKTAAAWTADAATVLAVGQRGLESDTRLFKFGNGSDLWSGLDYAGGSGSALTEIADTEAASFSVGASHANKLVPVSHGETPIVVTFPVAYDPPIGTSVEILRDGAAGVEIVPAASVTFEPESTVALDQYATAMYLYRGAATWLVTSPSAADLDLLTEIVLATASPIPADVAGTVQLTNAHFTAEASGDTLTSRASIRLTAETETLILPDDAPGGTVISPEILSGHLSASVSVSSGTYDLAQAGATTNASAIITGLVANGGTTWMAIGDVVPATANYPASTIVTVDSASQITIADNATVTGAVDVTVKVARNVFGYGSDIHRSFSIRAPIGIEKSVWFTLKCSSIEGVSPWSPSRWVTGERLLVVGGSYTADPGGNRTGNIAIDLGATSAMRGTLTGNVTFTFTAPVTGYKSRVDFDLTQDGVGGRTITIAGISWIGGAPSIPTTAGVRVFFTVTLDGAGGIVGDYKGQI